MAGEAEKIAAGLSAKQRAFLLSAYETVFMDRMKLPGKMKALRNIGLSTLAWRGGDLLTPLGLEVRASLQAADQPK